MKRTYVNHEVVVVVSDKLRIPQGAHGTIVHAHPGDAYEIEAAVDGETILETVKEEDIRKKTLLDDICEMYPDEAFLKADGLDEAVIGLDINSRRLIYSSEKCVELLMEQLDSDLSEALEYFEFNTLGAYVGEQTPIFAETHFE